MPYAVKTLGRGQVGVGVTTLYTAPSGKHALVKSILICNTSESNITLSLGSVPSGGSLEGPNIFFYASVVARSTISIDSLFTLAAGESLRGVATVGSAITYIINGVESV